MAQLDSTGAGMIELALILACAPTVNAQTIEAVIRVESAGDPLALNANRNGGAYRLRANDIAEGVRLAQQEINAGNSVDVGLMQINSNNFSRLGISLPQAFNPCTNIAAGARILTGAYEKATKSHGEGQAALRAALSTYNTGNPKSGFSNGYVLRYYERKRKQQKTSISVSGIYSVDPTVYVRELTHQEKKAMLNPELNPESVKNQPIVTDDQTQLFKPGVQVEMDAEQAERNGAFTEDALSEQDAWESNGDPSIFDADEGEGHGN
jgi:type IV secretion system protein VirB1